MARGDAAARHVRLLMMLLETRELDVERAAEEMYCTTRTLYRDLAVLERVGIPIYPTKEGKRVRWRLVEGFEKRLSIQLTVQEAMALVAAEQILSSLRGSMFDHAARHAVAKVKHALAPEIRRRVESLSSHLTTSLAPPRALAPHRAHLDQVMAAVEDSAVIELLYRKLDAEGGERYTFEPHHLHLHGTSLYVVGWVRQRRAPRVFLLDRIDEVCPTGERFTRRPQIHPGLFSQGAFGLWDGPDENIKLKFTGTAARIVAEQEFHPTQISEHNSDGTLTLSFRTPLSPALRQWVRSFGNRVQVIHPQVLRTDV